jgi:hypothetical protein
MKPLLPRTRVGFRRGGSIVLAQMLELPQARDFILGRTHLALDFIFGRTHLALELFIYRTPLALDLFFGCAHLALDLVYLAQPALERHFESRAKHRLVCVAPRARLGYQPLALLRHSGEHELQELV